MEGVNHELIVDTLVKIESDPTLWRQSVYSTRTACGTAHCFAGWAVVLGGEANEVDWGFSGEVVAAADRLLGITGWHREHPESVAYSMYSPFNSLDDLYRISAYWMGVDETVLRDKVRERL